MFFAAVAAVVLFASCRKQRVCVCTDNLTGYSYTETYYLTTKSNGKAYCEAEQSASPGYTCVLN